jgi:hypothetical protein
VFVNQVNIFIYYLFMLVNQVNIYLFISNCNFIIFVNQINIYLLFFINVVQKPIFIFSYKLKRGQCPHVFGEGNWNPITIIRIK